MLGITHATYPKIMTVMSINEDNEDHAEEEAYGDDDDDNGLEEGGRGSAPVNPLLLAPPPLHCYR